MEGEERRGQRQTKAVSAIPEMECNLTGERIGNAKRNPEQNSSAATMSMTSIYMILFDQQAFPVAIYPRVARK